MKISKLIALLEQAKSEFGDREVMLWNGFAQDVVPMNPEFVPETLYRPKKETFARSYAGFCIRDVVERAQKDNPSRTYEEVFDTISKEQIARWEEEGRQKYRSSSQSKWAYVSIPYMEDFYQDKTSYAQKQILIIQPKLKGETCYDRCGKMSY